MTFSLHQGVVVMSYQIIHTHNHHHTPLSPYTWHMRLDFQQLLPFYSLSQPHHVTASHPTPGVGCRHRAPEHWPEHGRAVRKNTGPRKKWPRETQLYMYQGSPLFPIFRTLTSSLHHHSSVAQSDKKNIILCLCVLFRGCCSRMQVLWPTLVHEYHTFYSNIDGTYSLRSAITIIFFGSRARFNWTKSYN